MYETRQNKEKVRRIDGSSMVRQRMNIARHNGANVYHLRFNNKNTVNKNSKHVVQTKFTDAGKLAKKRVANITGEDFRSDPFGGFSFAECHPTGRRFDLHPSIRNYIIANAPHDNGNPQWITCRYCNYEYPENRIHVDHYVNWRNYCFYITKSNNLENARALEIYIGCNDPYNLYAACDSCNKSKGDRTATQTWINNRRTLAQRLGGF